jgi:hypothetical protein
MSHREVCVVLHSINERYGGGEMMEEITRNLSESTATSVDSYMATWITLAILAFLFIVVPLFERIPILRDCISRRWVIVTITTTLMLSVVINFQHLNDSVREVIIIGGFIVGISYILCARLKRHLQRDGRSGSNV